MEVTVHEFIMFVLGTMTKKREKYLAKKNKFESKARMMSIIIYYINYVLYQIQLYDQIFSLQCAVKAARLTFFSNSQGQSIRPESGFSTKMRSMGFRWIIKETLASPFPPMGLSF
jgi:hypothetical protein